MSADEDIEWKPAEGQGDEAPAPAPASNPAPEVAPAPEEDDVEWKEALPDATPDAPLPSAPLTRRYEAWVHEQLSPLGAFFGVKTDPDDAARELRRNGSFGEMLDYYDGDLASALQLRFGMTAEQAAARAAQLDAAFVDPLTWRRNASLLSGGGMTPERAAEIYKQMRGKRLRYDAAAGNLDKLQRADADDEFFRKAMTEIHPGVVRWMQKNPLHAQAARDDMALLEAGARIAALAARTRGRDGGFLANTGYSLAAGYSDVVTSLGFQVPSMAGALLIGSAEADERSRQEHAGEWWPYPWRVARWAMQGVRGQMREWLPGAEAELQSFQRFGRAVVAPDMGAGSFQDGVRALPLMATMAAASLATGGGAAGTLAAGGIYSATATAGNFDELTEMGVSPEGAAGLAALTGAVQAATDIFAFGKLMKVAGLGPAAAKQLGGRTLGAAAARGLKEWAKATAAEMGSEWAESYEQAAMRLVGRAVSGQAGTLGEEWDKFRQEGAEGLRDALAVFWPSLLGGIMGATFGLANQRRRVRISRQTLAEYERASEKAGETPLKARAPGMLKDFVNEVASWLPGREEAAGRGRPGDDAALPEGAGLADAEAPADPADLERGTLRQTRIAFPAADFVDAHRGEDGAVDQAALEADAKALGLTARQVDDAAAGGQELTLDPGTWFSVAARTPLEAALVAKGNFRVGQNYTANEMDAAAKSFKTELARLGEELRDADKESAAAQDLALQQLKLVRMAQATGVYANRQEARDAAAAAMALLGSLPSLRSDVASLKDVVDRLTLESEVSGATAAARELGEEIERQEREREADEARMMAVPWAGGEAAGADGAATEAAATGEGNPAPEVAEAPEVAAEAPAQAAAPAPAAEEAFPDERREAMRERMLANAPSMPEPVAFTRENYNRLFPRGRLSTPLGMVVMGYKQFEKFMRKGREGLLLAAHDTLADPDAVIEDQRDDEVARVYVKTWSKPDGGEHVSVMSAVKEKGGEWVVRSTHERDLRNVLNKIKKAGQLLYEKGSVAGHGAGIGENPALATHNVTPENPIARKKLENSAAGDSSSINPADLPSDLGKARLRPAPETAVIDAHPGKEFVEVVGWRRVRDEALENIEKRAAKEGGQVLVNPGGAAEIASGLHAVRGSSTGNVTPVSGLSSENMAVGKPGVLVLADGTRMEFDYVVMELDDASFSHDLATHNPNPAYKGVQERAREGIDSRVFAAQTVIPELVVTESATAESGPPVIDPEGTVHGGYMRGSIINGSYAKGDGLYRNHLDANSRRFGIDPAAFAHMRKPGLFRRLRQPVADPAQFSVMLNRTMTMGKNLMETAVSRGAFVGENVLAVMADVGEDETTAAFLDRRGVDLASAMQKDHVFEGAEMAAYVDMDGRLTAEGRLVAEYMMLGHLVPSRKALTALTPAMRNKIIATAAAVIRTRVNAGYDLTPLMAGVAIHLMQKAGKSWEEYGPGATLFGDEYPVEPRGAAYELAKFYDTHAAGEIRAALDAYAAMIPPDAASGDLFGGSFYDPAEALGRALGVATTAVDDNGRHAARLADGEALGQSSRAPWFEPFIMAVALAMPFNGGTAAVAPEAVVAAMDPARYDTRLTAEEEAAFAAWRETLPEALRGDADYDLRGYWKANPGATAGEGAHLPDAFKKPNHPTFSDESAYSNAQTPGGHWEERDGKWVFHASPLNVAVHGAEGLREYFREAEPDAELVLPPAALYQAAADYQREYREIAESVKDVPDAELKAPNGQRTKLTRRQWIQVRTSAFKRWFGDWEAAAKGDMIDALAAIQVAPYDGDAEAAYAALGNGKNRFDGREVRFVNSTLGKILRHKGYPIERIIPQLKDVFDASVPMDFVAERERGDASGKPHKKHPNLVGYQNYLGKIKDGTGEYYVRFTVQEAKTRKKDYVASSVHSAFVSSVEIYKAGKENPAEGRGVGGEPGSLSNTTTTVGERESGGYDKILADFLRKVKAARANSSKVVDANGEPLVVYHFGSFGEDGDYVANGAMHFGTKEAADVATEEQIVIMDGAGAAMALEREGFERDAARVLGSLRQARGSDQARAAAKEFVGKPIVNRLTGMEVSVSNVALGKMLSKDGRKGSFDVQAHMQAVANLDKLFAYAVEESSRPGKKEGDERTIKAIHHFNAPMAFGDKVVQARMLVKEFVRESDGNRIYLVSAVEVDESGSPVTKGAGTEQAVVSTPAPGYQEQYNRLAEIVKRQNMGGALFQPAWHGSPHRFSKFTLDHIGSGEGAQAHGWGLYFAQDREVSEGYRRRLANLGMKFKVGGKTWRRVAHGAFIEWRDEGGKQAGKPHTALEALWQADGDKEEAINILSGDIARAMSGEDARWFEDARDWLTQNEVERVDEGQLYHADVPENDVLLDEQKTLDEQPEAVKRAALEFYRAWPDIVKGTGENGLPPLSGRQFYRVVASKTGGDRAASEWLNQHGVKGITYDGQQDGRCFVVFDDQAITMLDELYQAMGRGPDLTSGVNGWSTFKDGEHIIHVAKTGDKSTFLHETLHVFMREMETGFRNGTLTEEGREIWEQIAAHLEPFRVEGEGEDVGSFFGRSQHERLAREFEAYLLEGKEPSPSLRRPFQAIRAWMAKLYRSVRELIGDDHVAPDVKRIFDQILASEDERARVDDYYQAKQELLELYADDQEAREQAKRRRMEAERITLDRLIDNARKRLERLTDSADARRAEAEAEVWAEPLYAALKFAAENGSFDAGEAKRLGGKAALAALKRHGVKVATKSGKVPLDYIAEKFGFGEAEAFLGAVAAAPTAKELIDRRVAEKESRANAELKAQMEQELANGGDEADWAFHNDARLTEILTHYEQVLKRQGKNAPAQNRARSMAEAIKDAAEEIVQNETRMTPRHYYKYAQAEAREAAAAVRALKRGDLEAAEGHLKKQALNHALVMKAMEHGREIEEFRKAMRSRELSKRIEGVKREYREEMLRIAWVLRTHQDQRLAPMAYNEAQSADRLTADRQEGDAGAEAALAGMTLDVADVVPEWLRNNELPEGYRKLTDLTVREILEAKAAMDALEKRGKGALADAQKGKARTIGEIFDDFRERAEKTPLAPARDDSTRKGRWGKWLGRLQASMKGMLYFGREVGGAFQDIVERAHDHDVENVLLTKKIWEKLRAPFAVLREEGKKRGRTFDVPGVPLADRSGTHHWQHWDNEKLYAFALNMGTEKNRYALATGWQISDAQAQMVAGMLSKREWEAIQQIWDVLNELFPDLDAATRAVSDRAMVKEPALPLTLVNHAGEEITLRGGYYPLQYDGEASERAQSNSVLDDIKRLFAGQGKGNARARVADGMTRARAAGREGEAVVKLPPKLSLTVLERHVRDAARLITHASWVQDFNALMKYEKTELDEALGQEVTTATFRDVFVAHYGEAMFAELKKWAAWVARPERDNHDVWSAIFDWIRGSDTVYKLFYKPIVGLKQTIAAFPVLNAMRETGGKGNLAAFAQAAADFRRGREMVDFVNQKSAFLRSRDAATFDREVGDTLAALKPYGGRTLKIGGREISARDAAEAGAWFMTTADRAVNYPAWLAAYRQVIDDPAAFGLGKASDAEIEAAAVARADGIIKAAQPDVLPSALSGAQRAEGAVRLLTQFSSYTMGTLYNRMATHWNALRDGKQSPADFARFVAMEVLMPEMACAIAWALWTGGDDDDDDPFAALVTGAKNGFVGGAQAVLSPIPFARDVARGNYPELPGKALWTLPRRAAKRAAEGDAAGAAWAAAKLVGFVTGIPATNVFDQGARYWEEFQAHGKPKRK